MVTVIKLFSSPVSSVGGYVVSKKVWGIFSPWKKLCSFLNTLNRMYPVNIQKVSKAVGRPGRGMDLVVNHYHDSCVPSGFKEVHDEVCSDVETWVLWSGERHEHIVRGTMACLDTH